MTQEITLQYYCLDWDDNILHMNTQIIMEKLVDGKWIEVQVSTSDFAVYRKESNYRLPLKDNGDIDYFKAYSNFRDDINDDIFLLDVIEAIENDNFAPSYNAFKKCIINGNLHYIITARGHEPESIKKAVEYFIETQLNENEKTQMINNLLSYCKLFNIEDIDFKSLVKNYLSLCEYIGVSSDYFINLVNENKLCNNDIFDINNTEMCKKIALKYIINNIIQYGELNNFKIKIGFSDDDKNNIKSISELFINDLKAEFPDIEFSIFDTSKNADGTKNYKEIII